MLRWKQWYWYFLILGIFLPAITLTIVIVLKIQSIITDPSQMGSWITLSISSPLYMSAFFAYLYYSIRENYPNKNMIKPTRMRYFYYGLVSSFLVFSLYLLLWLIAFSTKNEIIWYVALPLIMIAGLISLIYFSLYEFCIAFDVFYSRNKEKLVHDFLRKISNSNKS